MSKKSKTVFSLNWIDKKINSWGAKVFARVHNNVFKALFRICRKSIGFNNMSGSN